MAFSIEDARELGFSLVHHIEGEVARFERVIAAGTQRVEAKFLEQALADIEARFNRHPGATSDVSARSDGALEGRDNQEAQSVAAGAAGPSPAADAAAAAEASAEPAEAVEEPAETPAAEEAPAEPEAPAEAPVVES